MVTCSCTYVALEKDLVSLRDLFKCYEVQRYIFGTSMYINRDLSERLENLFVQGVASFVDFVVCLSHIDAPVSGWA